MKYLRSFLTTSQYFTFFLSIANAADFIPFGSEPTSGTPIPPYAVVIADNQHTKDYGSSIFEQSYKANMVTSSARRSAVNNMFSLSLMEEVIAREKRNGAELVLHIGDGMNNGCASEWQAFSQSLGKSGLPWFLTPGNHDAFYLGISIPYANHRGWKNTLLDSADGWGRLCRPYRATDGYREPFYLNQEPRFIFTKRELIDAYLSELKSREPLIALLGVLDEEKNVKQGGNVTCNLQPNVKFLNRVCWYRNDGGTDWGSREPWGDFIVQELLWTDPGSQKKVAVILLDTSDFPARQKFARSCLSAVFRGESCYRFGGINVSLSRKQQEIVNRWLAKNKDNGIKTVLTGHHPIRKITNGKEWAPVNQHVLNWSLGVAKNALASAIVSAHTHDGYVARKRPNKTVEFNVGSLVDAPIHYMRMNWGPSPSGIAPRFSSIYLSKPKKNGSEDGGFYDKSYFKYCKKIIANISDINADLLKVPTDSSIKISRGGDRNGMESQLSSFLIEASLYFSLLPERGEGQTPNPVCYRVDKYGCKDGTLGKTCASAADVTRCDVEDVSSDRFDNMKVLQSAQDATELAGSVKRELEGLRQKKQSLNKARRIRRMIARKLDAIRIFDETNPPAALAQYNSVKSCLSLLASHNR